MHFLDFGEFPLNKPGENLPWFFRTELTGVKEEIRVCPAYFIILQARS